MVKKFICLLGLGLVIFSLFSIGVLFWTSIAHAQLRSTFSHSTVSVTTTEVQVLAANSRRNMLLLQNDHATVVIYCKFAATAIVNEGVRLNAAGGALLFDIRIPVGAIRCVGTGTGVLLINEGQQ